MLYLVATPIGNLEDFSFRALSALKTCDYILCEDTRHTKILLDHYSISRPLKSFHKFNLKENEERIIADLKEGKTIALLSDAGTPLISDPGYELISVCVQEGIEYTLIPGACAVIGALVLSGFLPTPFQFVGFFPKKEGELRTMITEVLDYSGTSLAYVSPHQVIDVLEQFHHLEDKRSLCIAREMTKKFEECLRGDASSLLAHFKTHSPRGEMVLIVSPPLEKRQLPLPSQALLSCLEKELSLSPKEALRVAAKLTGRSKNEIYAHQLSEKKERRE